MSSIVLRRAPSSSLTCLLNLAASSASIWRRTRRNLCSPDISSEMTRSCDISIHALNGRRVKTWTTEKAERNPVPVFWPKDLLKLKVPNARVLSFGYGAAIAHFYPLYGPKSVPPNGTIHHHSAAIIDNFAGLRNRTRTIS